MDANSQFIVSSIISVIGLIIAILSWRFPKGSSNTGGLTPYAPPSPKSKQGCLFWVSVVFFILFGLMAAIGTYEDKYGSKNKAPDKTNQKNANNSGNLTPSSNERTGRLTTNVNLRSAPNKTASSVGIHFQNARVRILDEKSYERQDGYSTWYKVQVTEYGCDSEENLGCGKNSDSDADEGWLNSKYVELD